MSYILNGKLIKEDTPCKVGDQVHIIGRPGCWTVHEVSYRYFSIMIKGKMFWETGVKEIERIPWDKFYCRKGRSPIKQAELEGKINWMLELAKRKWG